MERYIQNKSTNPFKARVDRFIGNDLEAIIALGMVTTATVATVGTAVIVARKTYNRAFRRGPEKK